MNPKMAKPINIDYFRIICIIDKYMLFFKNYAYGFKVISMELLITKQC